MRKMAVACLAAAAALLPVMPRAGAISAPQFATELVQSIGSGEPSVAFDPTKGGWTYVDAPEGTTVVWTKHGNGPFGPGVPTLGVGGDSDVAYDADGVLYASDLSDQNGNDPVSVSLDHGQSFAYKYLTVPPSATKGAGLWDRQWLTAWGHGNVVATTGYFPSLSSPTEVEYDWVSHSRGRTYDGPFTVSPPVGGAGRLARSPDGRLYVPYATTSGIGVAVSADGGRTWVQHTVAAGPKTGSFPGVAVDDSGAVYVTWAQVAFTASTPLTGLNIGGVVKIARSTDHGSTWTTPMAVSDPHRTAVMPWIVAGAKGKVAVFFYAARAPIVDTGPDLGTPVTHWDIEVSEILNARQAAPLVNRVVAIPGVHTGSICTEGIGCLSPEGIGVLNLPLPFDRRLLDFFGAAVRPNGSIIFAYPTDRPANNADDLLLTTVDIRLATQVGGPRLR